MRLGALLLLAVAASAQIVPIGPGLTNAYSIDRDGDGYGAGVKASGSYGPIGAINAIDGILTATPGDMPDADDQDATVHTTAQWRAKWGAASDELGAIRAFLKVRYGFTNGARVAFVSPSGDDATGMVNDIARPFATAAGVQALFSDFLGGVIVMRGGTYALCLAPPGTGCAQWSGSTGHPLYVMAYPGELVVQSTSTFSIYNSTSYPPQKLYGNVTFDGLVVRVMGYEYGDAGNSVNLMTFIDADHVTIRNCELLGGGKIFWGNHCWYNVVEWCVIHDTGGHAVYYGHAGSYAQPEGAADFDFDADEAAYLAGTSIGASRYNEFNHNIVYNTGQDGFGPVHNYLAGDGFVFDGNVLTANGGACMDFMLGVSHLTVKNNLCFANGRQGIVIASANPGQENYQQHHLLFQNNTILMGKPTDSIKNTNPSYPVLSNTVYLLHDVTFQANIFGTYNSGGNTIPMIHAGEKSVPDTWVFAGNWLYNFSGVQAPLTDVVLTLDAYAIPGNPGAAGSYTLGQWAVMNSGVSGNLYGDPHFAAADPAWGASPERFDLRVASGSGTIGAGVTDGVTTDVRGYGRTGAMDIGAFAFAPVIGTPPEIRTTSLPTASFGITYSTTLRAAGDLPITWSIVSGALPWGSLSSSGVLAGSPAPSAAATVAIEARNATGADAHIYTLSTIVGALIEGWRLGGMVVK